MTDSLTQSVLSIVWTNQTRSRECLGLKETEREGVDVVLMTKKREGGIRKIIPKDVGET